MGNKGIEDLRVLDSTKSYDVCVIGSGPAGTVVSKTLVEKGIRTVMIESGTTLFKWMSDKRIKGMAAFESAGNADYPLKHTRGCLLGGTSNFWTGRCERFHPSDFENHPYTPPENPWPVAYKELDPYYEKAEKLLRVRGGDRSKFTPPRQVPFPLSTKLDISYLKTLFGGIGVAVDDSPTATPTKSFRFFKIQKEVLPSFLSSPDFTLITGATVTRLLTDSDKRIVGAEVRTLDSDEKKIARAKAYVISCGGIGTPRLLLLSKSENFQDGIGNAYDRVGRGFNEHPAVNFYAQIAHQTGTIYPSNKIGRSHQFYCKYRTEGLGSVLPVFRQSWILPHHNMPFTIANIPRNVLAVLKRFIKATLYIGVVTEMKISDSNRVTLSDKMFDTFGDPLACLELNYSDEDQQLLERSRQLVRDMYAKVGARNIHEAQITFSRHHQGTCRMGDNPKTSVVDRNLKIHECPNLFIGGSEVFVTGGSMQPVTTIIALSYRLGDYLISRFEEGSI
jgi:choline dehydrogenase-like flavoprotein